jgi:hypothetical protein
MWLYLATDDSGSWAMLRRTPASEAGEPSCRLELELLGAVDGLDHALAAVEAVNRSLSALGLGRVRRSGRPPRRTVRARR